MLPSPELDSSLLATSPSDTKMTFSPPTNSSSSASCETYDNITGEYHPLGEYYMRRDRLQNVKPCEVEILSTPHDKERSAVCIIKHHGQERKEAQRKDYFLDELTAYRHLKNEGISGTGVVPDIYSVVLGLKPEESPDWELYHREGCYMMTANAILLENVEFHALDLTHGDTYPRNMMFVPAEDGKAERVLWLDFECGYSGPVGYDNSHDDLQRRIREDEAIIIDEFVRYMAIDATEHNGEVVKSAHWWRI